MRAQAVSVRAGRAEWPAWRWWWRSTAVRLFAAVRRRREERRRRLVEAAYLRFEEREWPYPRPSAREEVELSARRSIW